MHKTTFGRMRGGHSTTTLLALSTTIGLSIAAALGWLMSQNYPDIALWLALLIGIACMGPVLCVGTWALLVDLSTLKGRAERIDDSVENHWSHDAAAGTGTDLLIVLGLLTTVVNVGHLELPTNHLVLALLMIGMLSFGIRYTIAKRQGS
ncbi:hypothetical protein WG936_08685 [Corynebacterium sp. H127]|uniref:hypothetical protein n=1 Tax=Corynebacterium sp. H127 TaxID=3133418 RepID=UPI00309C59BD